MKTKIKGFTLVELVIVIAIVIILSVVSVPIYRGYTRQAKMAEAYALLGTILSSQKAYYSQYGIFLHCARSAGRWTDNDLVLGIDARGNKYFTSFDIGSQVGDLREIIGIFVQKPEDLRDDQSKNTLALYYNITSGATFVDNVTLGAAD